MSVLIFLFSRIGSGPLQAAVFLLTLAAGMSALHGKVVFEGPVYSSVLRASRIVRIYLPPSYEHEPLRRYPVLYLHDGQNVFSTVGEHVAFGWGSWQLDKTVDALIAEGRMREIIMVAVDCSSQRYQDYLGPSRKSLARAEGEPAAETRYERYARFLAEELKPKIDRDYRTLPKAKDTGVMGSSMGGICSLALAWQRPETFGLAASLSGAFQVERRAFIQDVLAAHEGKPKKFRIYLDSGVRDYSGGDDGQRDTQAAADQLRRIGWREGRNLLHYVDRQPLDEAGMEQAGLRRDKWAEARTSQHNEFYWRVRSWRALEFLFPPK